MPPSIIKTNPACINISACIHNKGLLRGRGPLETSLHLLFEKPVALESPPVEIKRCETFYVKYKDLEGI